MLYCSLPALRCGGSICFHFSGRNICQKSSVLVTSYELKVKQKQCYLMQTTNPSFSLCNVDEEKKITVALSIDTVEGVSVTTQGLEVRYQVK